jgi:hypothetical protein
MISFNLTCGSNFAQFEVELFKIVTCTRLVFARTQLVCPFDALMPTLAKKLPTHSADDNLEVLRINDSRSCIEPRGGSGQ